MDAAQLLAQIRAQRETWVQLDDRLAVKVRRPPEAEWRFFFGKTQRSVLENVQAYVVDWRGFLESDLLGKGIGASDAVPFSPELWAEIIADRLAWVTPIMAKLVDLINAHETSLDRDEKNSGPGLTPSPASSPRAKKKPANPKPS